MMLLLRILLLFGCGDGGGMFQVRSREMMLGWYGIIYRREYWLQFLVLDDLLIW